MAPGARRNELAAKPARILVESPGEIRVISDEVDIIFTLTGTKWVSGAVEWKKPVGDE